MKLLYDLFPLLLFFAAFSLYDVYVATAVAIVATLVQVAWHRLRTGRFETLHLITLGALVVLGGMTLALRDDTFIRWKPTIVYGVLAALTLLSHAGGGQTLLERLLGAQIALPPTVWRRLNISWGLFFLLLGALNLYVAFYYAPDADPAARLSFWVHFKVFGLTGLTIGFVLVQALVMARYAQPTGEEES